MKNFLKKSFPHLIAVAIFIILSSVYFSPTFNGYQLKQSDVKQFIGMQKEISDYRIQNGEEALWTNAMFSGMPAYQISVIHSSNWIYYVDRIIKLGLPKPVGVLFISMLGFYILALCLKIRPWIGIVGGIAFGFSTINILYLGAGHVTKINAISYMAPALGGLILAFRGRLIQGAVLFAFFMALNFSANHLQMTYYLIILMGAVAIAESVRLILAKDYLRLSKTIGVLLVASLLSVLPSIGNLMTTLEYSKYTTRGDSDLTLKPEGAAKAKPRKGLDKNYILEYNYGKRELLSIIAPGAQGERGEYIGNDETVMESVDPQYAKQISEMNKYWGGQKMSGGAFYFGVIMLVFALFGLIYMKDNIKWPLIIIGILCLFLASNNQGGVNDFFISKFPMYSSFRDSKMILVLLQVIIPLAGILFLEKLFSSEGLFGNKKIWLITAGVIVLIGIILYASPSISGKFITNVEVEQFGKAIEGAKEAQEAEYFEGLRNELVNARKAIYKSDMGRSAFLIFLACAFVIASLYVKISKLAFIGLAALMVTADNMSICKRYLNTDEIDEGNQSWEDELSSKTTYLASNSDLAILEAEKTSVSSFNSKVSTLKSKMEEIPEYEDVSERNLKEQAEFGVLNLNTNYRVLSFQNPFNETKTSYFHKSIGGYHGAKLKRYQELIEFQITKELQQISSEIGEYKNAQLRKYATELSIPNDQAQKVFDTIQVNQIALSDKTPVLNMLNTKYIVLDENKKAIRNTAANGNAWFVSQVKKVNSANEEMKSLTNLASKSALVVNSKSLIDNGVNVKGQYTVGPNDKIKLIKYGTKTLTYKSESATELPVVFSEIYYPKGWNFYVDGKLKPTFCANYLLRAAVVPAGKHSLEWRFEPDSIQTSKYLGLLGSIVLIGLAIFLLAKEVLKAKETEMGTEN
jgi:hypothetical protein